jgi:hypothetical protein
MRWLPLLLLLTSCSHVTVRAKEVRCVERACDDGLPPTYGLFVVVTAP